jgi:Icc-related predicted phosphoesterase
MFWLNCNLAICSYVDEMQRVALISDLHGNLTALQAVLADISDAGITRIICLGDLVGKGPRSDAVVDLRNWDRIDSNT